jgi:hypothetical protein
LCWLARSVTAFPSRRAWRISSLPGPSVSGPPRPASDLHASIIGSTELTPASSSANSSAVIYGRQGGTIQESHGPRRPEGKRRIARGRASVSRRNTRPPLTAQTTPPRQWSSRFQSRALAPSVPPPPKAGDGEASGFQKPQAQINSLLALQEIAANTLRTGRPSPCTLAFRHDIPPCCACR